MMDAFKKARFTDKVAVMLIGHTGVVKVPAGCTLMYQQTLQI